MSANEPLTKHRKMFNDTKTRVSPLSWEQRGGNLLIGYAASGIQGGVTLIRAFVRNLRAWLAMVREKAQVEVP